MKLLKKLLLFGYQYSQNVNKHVLESEERHGWPSSRERLESIIQDTRDKQEKIDKLSGEIYG